MKEYAWNAATRAVRMARLNLKRARPFDSPNKFRLFNRLHTTVRKDVSMTF